MSRQLGKFRLGGRVKYLSGIGYVETERNQASLFTDPDIFQLTFDTDYAFNSFNTVNIEDVTDFAFNTNLIDNFFSNNNGFAFDVGLSFAFNDKLSFSASILDLGYINWTEETSLYESEGSFLFEGINLDAFLLNDSVGFEIKIDTLEDIFAFRESETEARTNIGARFFLAGQYQLNSKLRLGGLVHFTEVETTEFTIGINAQYRLLENLLVGANYSYRRDSFSNLGFQFSANLGSLIIFGNTDNIISLLLNDNFAINGRIGLGLSL